MRLPFVVLATAVLTGCATSAPAHTHVPPGVAAPSSTAIDVTAYNREIERQGLKHYCGDGSCDTLPALLKAYAPIYPKAELESGVNGNATIVFDVAEDGMLTNFEVESATGDSFATAAVDALKLWRFAPPKLNGVPVKSRSRQSFPFVAR